MEYNGKSKEEYIKELKKKYGELAEPNEFNDDIYIKIEEALQEYEKGNYMTLEECDRRMKEKFPFLAADKKETIQIAEESEAYNIGKI